MPLDLYQLRTFFAVAQTLSYTEAAARLYVTQSAVSHAVAKLERGLKEDLFLKSGNRLALSEAGKILYRSCETVFYELERAEERLAAGRGRSAGTIRLGATVEFGTTLLVKYLKGFIEKNPGVHLDFQFRHELLKPLLHDDLDIIIDCKNHKAEGLEKTPLFREEYAVIASREFVRERRLRAPRDLAGCPVLSMDKSGAWWGNFLNALPQAERPDLKNITELNHIRAIINAALEGLGAGFVPRYCVLKEFKAKTLVNVFPHLKLLEDNFYVYQKVKRAGLERHRRLLEYLRNIKTTQLERA
ncbi:MAG: LysR family transcriptional regulator [Elusimicrobiales bacterium]|nr:LysR family transcriptional regulator [Elusimicrobiales bacterium]